MIMYISWCSICYQQKKLEDFKLVYNCLIKLAKIPKQHFQHLIISALHNCLLFYLKYKKFLFPKKTVKYLRSFFLIDFIFPPNAFDVIEIAVDVALHSESGTDISELIVFIEIICEELQNCFPKETAERLAAQLMLLFSKLEVTALFLYHHLSQHLKKQTNISIFSLFGNSIWKFIRQSEPFNQNISVLSNDISKISENPISSVEVSLRFWDKPSFVNGVNLKPNILFPDRLYIDSFLTEELKSRLDLIISTAIDDEDLIYILLDTLSSHISSLQDKTYFWDLNILFLYCCTHFYKKIRKIDAERLLSPPFFTPTDTVFDHDDNFQKISSLRSAVIQTLTKSPSGLAETALSHWITHPLLFAEITHRIVLNRQLLTLNTRIMNSFCRALMTSSLYYQQLHYSTDEDNSIEPIEIARTSVLLLISNFLSTTETMNMFWSNHFFTSFFLSFLFEAPLRSFVLSFLLSYLSKQQNELPNALLDNLQQNMQICFPSFPSDKFVIFVTDILNTLNEALIHQRSIIKCFEPFSSLLFSSFSSVLNTTPMQNYILQCIQFFAIVATPKDLGITQFGALDESIMSAFGSNIPQQLSNKLIQLIAGDNLASLTPTFFIRHPKAVQLFVHVSMNDPKLVEVVNFIKNLVQFSICNSEILRRSDFDLYLIDCIKDLENPVIIDAFLDLFHQISCIISSVAVVQRYVSLLSPFKGKYYSKFQEKYIQTLNNIVTTSLRYPSCSLRMDSAEGTVDITGLNYSDFENGFTFICWLQIDTPKAQYKPNLLYLKDSKGNSISVFISASNIFCEQKTTTYESTGKVESPIPKEKWSFVALRYGHDSEVSFLTPFYGIKSLKSLEFTLMQFQPGPLTCRIAGVTTDSIQSNIISRMSTFGLFPPLDTDVITTIYQMGPRGSGVLPVNPMFFYTSEDDNNYLTLKPKSTPISVECHLRSKRILCDPTFTNILVKFCKVQMLLPLLDQTEMRTKGGDKFSVEKVTIELLSNLLSTSRQTQESFYSSKGVNIISHLLYSVSNNKIDYPLYLQFYSLVQSITLGSLQSQFAKEILLDCELWFRADAENHVRIIRHWDRTLFPSMINVLSTMFQQILYIMRAYYWYTNQIEEQEYLKCENRGPFNVAECRQILSRVAVLLSTQNFTKNDFNCLASHCLTCADPQQTTDLLLLIRSIGQSDPCPLSVVDDKDLVQFLYSLLPRRNHIMLCLIFEIMITFYKNKLIKQSCLKDQINSIMDQLSPSRITPDLFFRCVESIQNGYFEMFPVCCWISFDDSISEDQALLMLSQIQPRPEFVTHATWCFWPTIFCYKCKSFIVRFQILLFLVNCNFTVWANIFTMIHDVGLILGKNSYEMKSLFLHCVAKTIESSNNATVNNVTAFYLMAKQHLLFPRKDDNDIISCSLDHLYRNSPFVPTIPPLKNGTNAGNSLSKLSNNFATNIVEEEIPLQCVRSKYNVTSSATGSLTLETRSCSSAPYFSSKMHKKPSKELDNPIPVGENMKEIVNKTSFINEVSRFGIRLDEDAKWIDSELAEVTINIFHEYPLKNFLYFDLILCCFLLHEFPQKVIAHIQNLSISQEDQLSCQGFIDLFVHHCFLVGIKPLFEPSPNFHSNAFKRLQKMNNFPEDDFVTLAKQVLNVLKNEFSDSARQKIYDLFDSHLDDMITESRSQMLNGIEREVQTKRKNKHYWSRLWRSLAVDPAPWSTNLGLKAHYKRDPTICAYGCPFKLKRNWKFDDHEEAFITPSSTDDNGNNNGVPINNNNGVNNNNRSSAQKHQQILRKERESIDNDTTQLIEISGQNEAESDLKHSLFNIPCTIITPSHQKSATFALFRNRIEIRISDLHSKRIQLSEIQNLFYRTYLHRPTAIELFTTMGRSFFINFPLHKSIPILRSIRQMDLPNAMNVQVVKFGFFFNQRGLKILWQRNQLSNFEYLMHLNMMSGRSFNDLSQYPIFPWVICDFISRSIDTSDSNVIRDMRKPVGALNDQRLVSLIEKHKNGMNFLYSTGPSCMYKVCHYLLRVEPFTTLRINLHNGKINHPDLLFKSINSSFDESTKREDDFCELIPEFFFDFEFLKNSNHFNFGNNIDDVVLPPWSKSTSNIGATTNRTFSMNSSNTQNTSGIPNMPKASNSLNTSDKPNTPSTSNTSNVLNDFNTSNALNDLNTSNALNDLNTLDSLNTSNVSNPANSSAMNGTSNSCNSPFFVYQMRKALESDYVSQTLNYWIDLIWGYKQVGPDSLSSCNVFAPELYESAWSQSSMSPLKIKHIEASLRYVGQIPPQLFTKPHPAKNIGDSFSKPFQQPFSIASSIKEKKISLAKFDITGNWKFNVIGIDSAGVMITHSADLTHRQSKSIGLRRSQPMLFNPDGLSMATSVSDNSVPNSKENDDLKGIDLTSISREIKGFAEIQVDIFEKGNMASQLGPNRIAVVSNESKILYVIDILKGVVEYVMAGVTGVAIYEDFIAVSKTDAVLNIYKNNFSNQLFSMPSYGDSITCCCVNGRFFVAIIGTRDGKLIINSLNKGNIVRVIDLHGARPYLVTVTNGWGFIVCYAQKISNGKLKRYLYVFSVNGETLQKRKIDFDIVIWTTWTSNKSFDYIAVADDNGKLFAFEVFYCDVGERLYRCGSQIATMVYMQDICCIAAVTRDGRILFVPYEISS